MLTNDQIKNLTDGDLETLLSQIKEEQKSRKDVELKTAKDGAIKAIEKYLNMGGVISMVGNYEYDTVYLECCSSEDIEKDLAVRTLTMRGF